MTDALEIGPRNRRHKFDARSRRQFFVPIHLIDCLPKKCIGTKNWSRNLASNLWCRFLEHVSGLTNTYTRSLPTHSVESRIQEVTELSSSPSQQSSKFTCLNSTLEKIEMVEHGSAALHITLTTAYASGATHK